LFQLPTGVNVHPVETHGCASPHDQSKRISLTFARPRIKIIPQQSAINFCGIEFNSSRGPKSYFFGQLRVARKHATCVALAIFFHEVADTFVCLLQRFYLTQSFTILRIEKDNAISPGRYGRFFKVAFLEMNVIRNTRAFGVCFCYSNCIQTDVGSDDLNMWLLVNMHLKGSQELTVLLRPIPFHVHE